ncbi:NUDIX domain-containing protein [Salinirubellus salinus]|uniref:NUDIX domain-containing protein n=1 Tax=Salinirubellus salinus TaxID=1364945 RepID=A0A9E7R3R1_9EURY|nr:NUDIX domain-containing protein [Salinirubellus salinus]UWM54971.1 NUDIX domain-containing protein [Salinirubellus salinus]
MEATDHEHGYVVNVDAAVVRGDEYLVVRRGADERHAAGALAFPGGKVESGPGTDDPIAATAAREVHEEVGVEVGTVEYVCSRAFESDTGTPCLNVVTRCAYAGGEAHRAAPEEVAAVAWRTPDAIRDDPDAPGYLVEYLDRVEASRGGDT